MLPRPGSSPAARAMRRARQRPRFASNQVTMRTSRPNRLPALARAGPSRRGPPFTGRAPLPRGRFCSQGLVRHARKIPGWSTADPAVGARSHARQKCTAQGGAGLLAVFGRRGGASLCRVGSRLPGEPRRGARPTSKRPWPRLKRPPRPTFGRRSWRPRPRSTTWLTWLRFHRPLRHRSRPTCRTSAITARASRSSSPIARRRCAAPHRPDAAALAGADRVAGRRRDRRGKVGPRAGPSTWQRRREPVGRAGSVRQAPRQRREFLVAVRDYNFSIADYALAVVVPSASRDTVVATLIETAPKVQIGAGEPAPRHCARFGRGAGRRRRFAYLAFDTGRPRPDIPPAGESRPGARCAPHAQSKRIPAWTVASCGRRCRWRPRGHDLNCRSLAAPRRIAKVRVSHFSAEAGRVRISPAFAGVPGGL